MLLEEGWEWSAAAPFLVSGGTERVILDGLPLVPFGPSPVPPRSSRVATAVSSPVEAGLWSRGEWCLTMSSRPVPDSSLESGFSLLQNTVGRSRYEVYLRRRLPGSVLGSFGSHRGDSSAVSMAALRRNSLSGGGVFWESGYSLNAGFSQDGLPRLYGGFSRLSPGDRRPFLLGEFTTYPGRVSIGAGLGAAWSDPDLLWRGAFRAGLSLGDAIISLHGDMDDSSHVLSAGLSVPGMLSAGVVLPDSGPVGGHATGAHGPFRVAGRFNDVNRAAVSFQESGSLIRGAAGLCWDFDRDSLSLAAWVLPGMNWYRARVEAGGRVSGGVDAEGGWTATFDALAGFTLRTFSFALGLQDLTRPADRSWTFGVTWSFTDEPPAPPEEREEPR